MDSPADGRWQRIRQLQLQIESGSARLRFEPALEREFRAHLNELHKLPRYLSALVMVSLTLALVLMDRCCMGHRLTLPLVYLSLLGVCLPLALLTTVLWRNPTYRHRTTVTGTLYLYIGAVYLVVLTQLTGDGLRPPYLYEALLIHLIAMYLISGLRLLPASLLGFGLWFAYLACETRAGLSRPALLESGLFLFAANATGAASRYATEYLQRQQFLSSELLKDLASHDPLTGVLNRRAFEHSLHIAWRQARRDRVALTLAVLDLDHFKAFNDRYGHARGDELLVALAETLRDMAQRPLDLVARVGGDEFVCFWYGVPDGTLASFVAEVHATLNERLAGELPPEAPPVSVSLGAVHLLPAVDLDAVALFARADAVLYQAKEAGRSRAALALGDLDAQLL